MQIFIHRLIMWVRNLRRIRSFKVTSRAIVITLMILGAWVATTTSFDLPEGFDFNDKVKHLVVFFGFAFLMDLAISRHPFWLWKGLPLLFYGVLIEVAQYFSPEREFSYMDMLADFLGILLYFLVKITLVLFDSQKE